MTDGENRLQAGTLKTDQRGRVRSTVAQRKAVLAKFERSWSGPQFARFGGYPRTAALSLVSREHQSRRRGYDLPPPEAGAA